MTVLQYYVYSTITTMLLAPAPASSSLVLISALFPYSYVSEAVQYDYTTHCNDYFTHTWSVLVSVMCHSQYYPYLLLSYVCIQYTSCRSSYCYLAPVQTLHVSNATLCLLLQSIYVFFAYLVFSSMTYLSMDDSVSSSDLSIASLLSFLRSKTLVRSRNV